MKKKEEHDLIFVSSEDMKRWMKRRKIIKVFIKLL